MVKDFSKTDWHGIPRMEIPWYPTINEETCIGCGLCYVSCGREVFGFDNTARKATVSRKFNCMVGCSTCATICPVEAIAFPGRELIQKIEREHKILKVVREKAKAKLSKDELIKARAAIEQQLAEITSQMHLQIAGEFGEKQFLVQLWDLLNGLPFDIVNLKLNVPTVQGARSKTPSFMEFDVISTTQENVLGFLQELRKLIDKNHLVVVSESKI